MKTIILIIAVVISPLAMAETFHGKKFKMTYDKKTQTLEGEVWDTTRSEHLLTIKTIPEKPKTTEKKVSK